MAHSAIIISDKTTEVRCSMSQMIHSETTRIQPLIGDVYMVQFDGTGSVQRGFRPAVVFSNNVGNAYSPNVVVLPLTTSLKKANQPTHVILEASSCGLRYTSMVLCENPQSISKSMLGNRISHLGKEEMAKIAAAYLVASSAISFIDFKTLVGMWEQSIRLNAS